MLLSAVLKASFLLFDLNCVTNDVHYSVKVGLLRIPGLGYEKPSSGRETSHKN